MLSKKLISTSASMALLLLAIATAPSSVAAGSHPVARHRGDGDRHDKQHQNDHQVIHETVNWSISPTVCSAVSATINGTGKREMEISKKTNRDGSSQIVTHDVVEGTATDGQNKYRFVYRNRQVEDVPASGAPIQVHMVDSFLLTGHGGPALNVFLDWNWTYSPPSQSWPPESNLVMNTTRGDINCDPI